MEEYNLQRLANLDIDGPVANNVNSGVSGSAFNLVDSLGCGSDLTNYHAMNNLQALAQLNGENSSYSLGKVSILHSLVGLVVSGFNNNGPFHELITELHSP